MQLNENRLGEMLLEAGLIDQFQLESALSMQRNLGGQIGSALVKMGYLPEETIIEFLETQEAYAKVSIAEFKVTEPLLSLLSFERMQKMMVVPLELRNSGSEKNLRMAMTDPSDKRLIDDLQFATGCKIIPVLATEADIELALKNNQPQPPPDLDSSCADAAIMDSKVAMFNRVSAEDPRLDRLLAVLKEKGVLSVLDVERIKFG